MLSCLAFLMSLIAVALAAYAGRVEPETETTPWRNGHGGPSSSVTSRPTSAAPRSESNMAIPVTLHDPRPGRPRARLVSERAATAAVWASNSAS